MLVAVLTAALAGTAGAQPAATPPAQLRIVGGLANLHPYTLHEKPPWTEQLPRLSQGRARAEIVPFDRAGIHAGIRAGMDDHLPKPIDREQLAGTIRLRAARRVSRPLAACTDRSSA